MFERLAGLDDGGYPSARRELLLLASDRAGGAPVTAEVLVASNRGPLSFQPGEDGSLTAQPRWRRPGVRADIGVARRGALWIAPALSDYDRRPPREARTVGSTRPGHDTEGLAVRMLEIDPLTFQRAYNAVANSTLWFVHHLLYDTPLRPTSTPASVASGRRTCRTTEAFAVALAEEAAPERASWCRTTTCRSCRGCCASCGPTSGSALHAHAVGHSRLLRAAA